MHSIEGHDECQSGPACQDHHSHPQGVDAVTAAHKPMNRRTAITRRQLLQSAMATGVGLTILPSGVLRGANAPSNKLNIAMIGTWGRARAHFDSIKSENVVALCDVNEQNLAKAAETVPRREALQRLAKVPGAEGH